MANVAWLLGGDFNVILNMFERSDFFQGMPVARNVLEFRSCIEDINVTDLHADGPLFTWSNNRQVGFVALKLDRFLVNEV